VRIAQVNMSGCADECRELLCSGRISTWF